MTAIHSTYSRNYFAPGFLTPSTPCVYYISLFIKGRNKKFTILMFSFTAFVSIRKFSCQIPNQLLPNKRGKSFPISLHQLHHIMIHTADNFRRLLDILIIRCTTSCFILLITLGGYRTYLSSVAPHHASYC